MAPSLDVSLCLTFSNSNSWGKTNEVNPKVVLVTIHKKDGIKYGDHLARGKHFSHIWLTNP